MSPAPQTAYPRRAEVYLLDFAPATGHEMTGLHPCVVVQNDVGNQHSRLTIVVSITSNLRVASLPVGVFLTAGTGGVLHDCAAHCGHVDTVDKRRLVRLIGTLPDPEMLLIDKALVCSLGL